MTTLKERQKIKAVKRSQMATKIHEKNYRSADDLERLERFKRRQLLFRKFN